mgnify:CR=1 FL=1
MIERLLEPISLHKVVLFENNISKIQLTKRKQVQYNNIKEMINMFGNLGNRITSLRKEAGMTQQQLADIVSISRPSLVKIENSQRAISLEEGDAISKALGISLDSLLTYEDTQKEEVSFAKAFKTKGMNDNNLAEIAKFELLFDALITQEQIYRG